MEKKIKETRGLICLELRSTKQLVAAQNALIAKYTVAHLNNCRQREGMQRDTCVVIAGREDFQRITLGGRSKNFD